VCAFGVARELHGIGILQFQNFLEPPSNRHEGFSAFLGRSALSILVSRNGLADSAGPQADSVETFPDVDYNSHNLIVAVILKGLANSGELCVQPELIDGDSFLVLEGIGPLAAVLVLLILPFWPDAFLEEVVVCFEA
jgi:hypothetical protein